MDEILQKFEKAKRAAFRTREYAALLGKKAYAGLVLHRLKLRGKLILVRKGIWAFPKSMPEAIACEISMPCYLSFHSALYLHSLTTQIPRTIQLAVTRNGRKYEMLGYKVKEYKIKRKLFKGFVSKDGLLIATPEKAFADSLNIPKACPEIILKEARNGVDIAIVKQFISKGGFKRMRGL